MSIINRRTALALAAAASLAAALPARAADEIVIGGSIPLTGVFAFAGEGIHKAMQDWVQIVNEDGGVNGRMLKYVPEDTGYKVDASVAAFNKITAEYQPNFYYGDSTGFAKTINDQLNDYGLALMGGASFASEINDPERFPNMFIAGPDYTQMVSILLEYIAEETPGAKVAFVNSDTEFGRDPIETSAARAQELGLEVAEQIITAPGSVDVSTEVLKLRRARPDYTIFHGYVLAPIPEFIQQAKEMGLDTKFMGTFWTMDNSMVMKMGDAAEGFMGVMPYNYYYSDQENAPMLDRIREMRGEYQSTAYMQGFLTAMLMTEAAKRTLDAGKELNGPNLKAALQSIENFDTGGIVGVPISVTGNTVPVGRIYRADTAAQKMVPVSDWIDLSEAE